MKPKNPDWYPCGHPRTAANTVWNSKRAKVCRACRNVTKPKIREVVRSAKYRPKPLKWISAPREVIESCRPAFLAAIEPKKPTGRPRKVA